MGKKWLGYTVFLIWFILFSIYLLLTDWLQCYHRIYLSYLYWGSYPLYICLLLLIKNSFLHKALLSFLVGMWMHGLFYVFAYLPKLLPSLYGTRSSWGEPTFVFLNGFFMSWCFIIAGACLIISLIKFILTHPKVKEMLR